MSQVWLITGAARGLGRSIVEAALAAGNKVVATARDPGRLADLKAEHGDSLLTFALDVTDAEASGKAVQVAITAFGRLDVLVNNAGFGHIAPFEQASAEDFKAQIDTNLYGVVNLTRAALPMMRKQRSGTIINVSSVGGRLATPGLSAYQAAKWAVGGFTEVLALEAAPFGVKVIALEPGGMRTDWGHTAHGNVPDLLPDYQPSVGGILQLMQAYAGNEVGDPDKIARLVVSLPGRESLPNHLVLGSDALYVLGQAEAVRQKAASEWAEVSASTDFEGSNATALLDSLHP
ncbi:short-chain dehydrogenase/reductase [Labrys miyagiensis]|uniref:Short-chain dehydrogenase/reductase n=1 Tax=Labrys miyagiensis TaxID=346912 RepID=A0ABQ6CB45_9HYPH|nr:SDR family NAD(P)-dependent oxidoreductase [Labrys miyagiensis]GLS17533.1 short-chain dehydrogenase/reductase [Labrys miyagiensis]